GPVVVQTHHERRECLDARGAMLRYGSCLLHRDGEGLALRDDKDRQNFLPRGAPYILVHMLRWDIERRPWLLGLRGHPFPLPRSATRQRIGEHRAGVIVFPAARPGSDFHHHHMGLLAFETLQIGFQEQSTLERLLLLGVLGTENSGPDHSQRDSYGQAQAEHESRPLHLRSSSWFPRHG